MKRADIIGTLVSIPVFLAYPNVMGAAFGIMAMFFIPLYYGYRGTMKLRALHHPVRVFFLCVFIYAAFIAIFGQPDTRTTFGTILYWAVPIALSIGILKVFYSRQPVVPVSEPQDTGGEGN
ncbi:MAG TPA: hypothetical protein VF928_14015 [Usitatibacteraceae bacterium]